MAERMYSDTFALLPDDRFQSPSLPVARHLFVAGVEENPLGDPSAIARIGIHRRPRLRARQPAPWGRDPLADHAALCPPASDRFEGRKGIVVILLELIDPVIGSEGNPVTRARPAAAVPATGTAPGGLACSSAASASRRSQSGVFW